MPLWGWLLVTPAIFVGWFLFWPVWSFIMLLTRLS